jgi:hypothetical protein
MHNPPAVWEAVLADDPLEPLQLHHQHSWQPPHRMLNGMLHLCRPTALTRFVTCLRAEVIRQQRRQICHWGPVADAAKQATGNSGSAAKEAAAAAIAAAVVVLRQVEDEVVELLFLHCLLAAHTAGMKEDNMGNMLQGQQKSGPVLQCDMQTAVTCLLAAP